MNKNCFLVLGAGLLFGAGASAAPSIAERLDATLRAALPRMGCNLSPREAKQVPRLVNGEWRLVEVKPSRGAIVASPSLHDPDYYFHWLRDSSLVADALRRLRPQWQGTAQGQKLEAFLEDYIHFSRKLQGTSSAYGLGDPRFNVDGSPDEVFWSRPQNDGPALRALTLARYLNDAGDSLRPALRAEIREIVLADVNYVATHYPDRSFDLWEYSFGHHLYPRVMQLAALELAQKTFPDDATPAWSAAIASLRAALADHWDAKRGIYHFSVGPVFDGEGHAVGEVGGGPDSSVIFAATHSGRVNSEFSLSDPKLLATAWKLEEFFRRTFPFNANHPDGPAIGRHEGDGYYGGNAFYFLTAGYAEFYYRLAHALAENQAPVLVDENNREALEKILGKSLPPGTDLSREAGLREQLRQRCLEKGDAFMATMMDATPASGNMAEQFSKVDGRPASADDLTWSYSSFLSAALARKEAVPAELDFRAYSLDCFRPTLHRGKTRRK